MPTAKELLRASRVLDWGDLEPLLLQLCNDNAQDRIRWLVGEIRRQGYTICRRPREEEIKRRDVFRDAFRLFLDKHGLKDVADEWRADDMATASTEWGYHRILASVDQQVRPHMSPDRHVWAMLQHVATELNNIKAALETSLSAQMQRLDPAAIQVVLPDGSRVMPDDYASAVVQAASATLKMLAMQNSWCQEGGRILLPNRVSPEAEDVTRAANVQSLGVVWQLLERSDEHIRFFGGKAEVNQCEFKQTPADAIRIDALEIAIEGTAIVYDRIAHERLERMLMQCWNQLSWETQVQQHVIHDPPIALPPAAVVSVEEAFADLALSEILCVSVTKQTEEYAGLQVLEWVRAYAALKLFAKEHMAGRELEPVIEVKHDAFRDFLTSRGLTADKAERFREAILFGRRERDLFDAPLLAAADGKLYLCAAVAAAANPVQVVLSRLAVAEADLTWRGPAFEAKVLALFGENKIPAHRIKRQVQGQQLEVDCVAYWQDTLFVLECKNMALPGRSNESLYWFYEEQEHARQQVVKKRDALLANPQVLDEVFGMRLQIKRTAAVILNAMPFSVGEIEDGVYAYDYSALHRFFQDGVLRVIMPAKITENFKVLRRHGIKRLWSADRPSPDDLLAQMREPVQLAGPLTHYEWKQVVLPLGHKAVLATFVSQHKAASLEEDLTAAGIDGARVAAEIEEISRTFAEKMNKMRQKVGDAIGPEV